jgi:muconate cycloisomerase
MSDAPIANIALHHIALPLRREHKWTGLTEPIGGYVLVEMTDAEGLKGWGEAPALKDWVGISAAISARVPERPSR